MKKKIILNISIILLSISIIAIGIFVYNASVDYVSGLIIDEQNDHYNKMQEQIQKIKEDVLDIQDDVKLLKENKLTDETRKELYKKLRSLESVSLNITKEMTFYQEDTTVHIFFPPEDKITLYFDQTRNTPLYINRFVRTIEQGLFELYVVEGQINIIQKNYDLLVSEINSIDNQ